MLGASDVEAQAKYWELVDAIDAPDNVPFVDLSKAKQKWEGREMRRGNGRRWIVEGIEVDVRWIARSSMAKLYAEGKSTRVMYTHMHDDYLHIR
jgi:hypothetical protein